MRHLRRSRLLLVAVLVAAIASGAAAYALADSGQSSPAEQLNANPGPEPFLHASGVTASEAHPAFALQDGQTVSVIEKGSTRCLLHGIGARTAGRCFSEAAITEGAAVTVYDECASSGRHLMEITGLVPPGTTAVRLSSSDGRSQDATVVDGAFKFEGTNPAAGAPYPTAVAWITSSGAATGSADLPVSAGQFCLPTS